MGKKILNGCMNIIDEEIDLVYMEEGKIDGSFDMEREINLFHFLDKFFKNNQLHLTLNNCINNKVKDWKHYSDLSTKSIEKLDTDMVQMNEEKIY
jgi:hypothetical protein